MDLEQLLAELAKLDSATVLEAVKKNKAAKAMLFQPAFNEGHGVAMVAMQAKVDEATASLATEKAARAKAEKDLQTERDGKPDVEKIHADYKSQLEKKDSDIAALKEEQKQSKVAGLRSGAEAKLLTLLTAELDPAYAEVQVERKANKGRIEVTEEGSIRVLQAGQAIPFAGSIEEQIAAFAQEIIKAAPETMKRSEVDAGSGRASASGGASGTKGKALYDKIREQAKASVPAAPEKAPEDVLAGRLGMA